MEPMHRVTDKVVLTRFNGRFGNRLHTYAYARSHADRFDQALYLPGRWEGSALFAACAADRVIDHDGLREHLNQTAPENDRTVLRRGAVEAYARETGDALEWVDPEDPASYGRRNVAFEGLCCWRRETFLRMRAAEVRRILTFSDRFKESAVYKHYERRKGSYVAVHVRRGDITSRTDGSGYSVLSTASYRLALADAGYDPADVVVVSDDPQLATPGFDFDAGAPTDGPWRYPDGQDRVPGVWFPFVQDFLKLVFAGAVFRANSSFSWWAAFLSEGRVFSPVLSERADFPSTGREVHCDFVEGNAPHWHQAATDCPEIELR